MSSYFHKTDVDEAFYDRNLRDRLPASIIDAHAHFILPEQAALISEESIAGDWAMQCGINMTYEQALHYTSVMFPDFDVGFVALPCPMRELDSNENNAYIASLIKDKGIRGLFTLRPEFDCAQIERDYLAGGFCGFKPYPYMADPRKGADISIFDFVPHEQFALADKLRAAVLVHLPRAERLPHPENISEIREILDKYPNLKLVIAHFGRCFQHEYFERSLEALGDDVHRFWFDTAAVLNPKVYTLAAKHLDHRRVIFGTDLPVMLWHGKREWDEHGYYNLCREDFPWNKHKYPQDEAGYTYYIYEQLNNLMTAYGDDREKLEDIFSRNAEKVYT